MADIKIYGKLVANTESKTIADDSSIQDTSKNQKLNVTLQDIQANIESLSSAVKGKQESLTTEQKNAINSGITSNKVSTYDAAVTKVNALGTAANKTAGTSAGNVPVLDANGKLPNSVIPPLAIHDVFVRSSQAEMVALSAQKGDVCIRSDLSKTFILKENDPSLIDNWEELLAPVVPVPTKTSELTNDSGFITSSYHDSTKQDALTTAQKNAANSGITSAKVTSYDNHLNNTDVHVTAAEKSTRNNKVDDDDLTDIENRIDYLERQEADQHDANAFINNALSSTDFSIEKVLSSSECESLIPYINNLYGEIKIKNISKGYIIHTTSRAKDISLLLFNPNLLAVKTSNQRLIFKLIKTVNSNYTQRDMSSTFGSFPIYEAITTDEDVNATRTLIIPSKDLLEATESFSTEDNIYFYLLTIETEPCSSSSGSGSSAGTGSEKKLYTYKLTFQDAHDNSKEDEFIFTINENTINNSSTIQSLANSMNVTLDCETIAQLFNNADTQHKIMFLYIVSKLTMDGSLLYWYEDGSSISEDIISVKMFDPTHVAFICFSSNFNNGVSTPADYKVSFDAATAHLELIDTIGGGSSSGTSAGGGIASVNGKLYQATFDLTTYQEDGKTVVSNTKNYKVVYDDYSLAQLIKRCSDIVTFAQAHGVTNVPNIPTNWDNFIDSLNQANNTSQVSDFIAIFIQNSKAAYLCASSLQTEDPVTVSNYARQIVKMAGNELTSFTYYPQGQSADQNCIAKLENLTTETINVPLETTGGSGNSVSGGSGKLYAFTFEVQKYKDNKIIEFNDEGIAEKVFFRIYMYESNFEQLKQLLDRSNLNINTPQDLVNLINSFNSTQQKQYDSENPITPEYIFQMTLTNLIKFADKVLFWSSYQNGTIDSFMQDSTLITDMNGSILTKGQGANNTGRCNLELYYITEGTEDMYLYGINTNNSCTLTEYGSSGSGSSSINIEEEPIQEVVIEFNNKAKVLENDSNATFYSRYKFLIYGTEKNLLSATNEIARKNNFNKTFTTAAEAFEYILNSSFQITKDIALMYMFASMLTMNPNVSMLIKSSKSVSTTTDEDIDEAEMLPDLKTMQSYINEPPYLSFISMTKNQTSMKQSVAVGEGSGSAGSGESCNEIEANAQVPSGTEPIQLATVKIGENYYTIPTLQNIQGLISQAITNAINEEY